VYDHSYFFGGGAGYSDYASERELLVDRGRMYAEKAAEFTIGRKVLDVGAAAGYILQGFVDAGWHGMGLEPNAAMAKLGQSSGLDVRIGTLETFETPERFDLISMVQVAGHFYEPMTAFSRAMDLLNTGGLLLVETWDRRSVSARLFGRHWHEYSPPSVLHWFSRSGLDVLLTDIGFESVASGRPTKKISGGHVRSLLRYRIGGTRLWNVIPQNIVLPYPAEDLFWSLFRKP
jgi:SAM-dependent methyltransferase